MNSTTNPAPEKDIHKDVEDRVIIQMTKHPTTKYYHMMQLMTKVIKMQMKYKIHQIIQTKIQRITKIK